MISEKNKRIILIVLGIFFILLSIAAYANSIYRGYPGQILWFCYLVILLIGIGMLIQNSTLIVSQLNIMAVPLIIWSTDLLYVFATGNELFGIASYFLIPGPIIGKIVTSQHLFTLPLAIFALYLIKIKRKDAWKFSFIELGIVFIVTRLITLEEYNVNCVYKNCLNFNVGAASLYPLTWFVLGFSLVILTSFIINKIGFLRH